MNALTRYLASETWQNYAIFCAIFFLVSILLTAFVLIPKLNDSAEEQYQEDLKIRVALEVELFNRFLQSHKGNLDDLAKFPSITKSVMLSDVTNRSILDLLDNIIIESRKGRLVLQNIAGDILIQTTEEIMGTYSRHGAWLEQLLSGEKPFYFKLLRQDTEEFTFQLSVPVAYNSHPEGILSAEITVAKTDAFVTPSTNNNTAIRLTQENIYVQTNIENIRSPFESNVKLDNPDLQFTYITDFSIVRERERSMRNLVLAVLLCGLIFSFITFSILAHFSLGEKNRKLSVASSSWKTYIFPLLSGLIGIAATITVFLFMIYNAERFGIDKKLQWLPFLVLFAGIGFSLIVTLSLIKLFRHREILELVVQERTAELGMANDLIANANDVFMITETGNSSADKYAPKIVYVNDAHRKLTGYTRKESIGEVPQIFLEKSTGKIELEKIRAQLENGGTYQGEFLNHKKNGAPYWVDVTLWPLNNTQGEVTQFAAVKRDVTNLKEEEQKLIELQQAMQMAVEGVSKIDPQGCYTYVNDAYAGKIGYQPHELVGNNWEMTIVEEQIGPMKKVYQDMLDTGKVVAETIGQCKNGSRIHKRVTMISDYNQQQEFTGHFCFMQDITEQKKSEIEREKLIDRLVSSNEQLERFAFICSHDLQEPLRMIRSFSKKLIDHMKDRFARDEKGTRYLEYIKDGAERSQNLIADILSYSKIDNDTQVLEEVDTNELIIAVQENIIASLNERGGRLTYDELPYLSGNKTQLFQLFQNLINNALKYQKPKSTPKIHIGVEDAGKYWKFAVEDNGIGIEERHLKKIFDVFQRLHNKKKYAGTGIGLSICKKVVERHGGTIWVESEKNIGTTFYFTILKPEKIEVSTHDPQYQVG